MINADFPDLFFHKFIAYIDAAYPNGGDFDLVFDKVIAHLTAIEGLSCNSSDLLSQVIRFSRIEYKTPKQDPFREIQILGIHTLKSLKRDNHEAHANISCLLRLAPFRKHYPGLPINGWDAIIGLELLVNGFTTNISRTFINPNTMLF